MTIIIEPTCYQIGQSTLQRGDPFRLKFHLSNKKWRMDYISCRKISGRVITQKHRSWASYHAFFFGSNHSEIECSLMHSNFNSEVLAIAMIFFIICTGWSFSHKIIKNTSSSYGIFCINFSVVWNRRY
jgi:hypothetical protein